MTKKQIISIISVSAALAALLIVYLAVLKPIISRHTSAEDPGNAVRYYMYDHLDRAEMKSIEVENEHGSFRMIKNDDSSFSLDGYLSVKLNANLVSSLVTACGSSITKATVWDGADDEKLEEYGLKDPIASWTVTDNEDRQYKVYVGRELLTGGGYYCMFAGRDTVYVLDTMLAAPVLYPPEKFVEPYIIYGVSKDDYFKIDNFTVFRCTEDGNERIITIGQLSEEEFSNPDALAEAILTYPAPYTPKLDVYGNIFYGFISFSGDETVCVISDEDYSSEETYEKIMAEYGFDDPLYIVMFEYNGTLLYFVVADGGEDSYLVLSNIYPNVISRISRSSLEYLEYDLAEWISPYIEQRNITTISSVSVKSASVDEKFLVAHYGENGADSIQVKSENGLELTSAEETANFRHFYGDVIAIAAVDALPDEASEGVLMEDFIADDENLTMEITIETVDGDVDTIKIYRYSTRRCALSFNGSADFCIIYDDVRRIEDDAARLAAGETVKGLY
ncbi:MAG: DUF4340 domain-containing protein [Clostridia bacterium]|nr:DUF4340 domain-containing protein [Clostridia bacterium]